MLALHGNTSSDESPAGRGGGRKRTGDDRVDDDGERGGGYGGVGDVLGQVVVILDGLQGDGLAVEPEVVDGHGNGEESLDCWFNGG